jgi:hypothetical protein
MYVGMCGFEDMVIVGNRREEWNIFLVETLNELSFFERAPCPNFSNLTLT